LNATKEIARALRRDFPNLAANEITAVISPQVDRLGQDAFIADALGTNTKGLLQNVYANPGPAAQITEQAFRNRQLGQQDEIVNALGRAINASGKTANETLDEIAARQASAAKPLYRRAERDKTQIDVSPIIRQISGRLPTAKGPEEAALNRALPLFYNKKGELESTTRGLNRTKKALDAIISNASIDSALGRSAQKSLVSINNQLKNSIDVANPKYRLARQTFASAEDDKAAAELGANIFKGDAEINNVAIKSMAKSERDALTQGAFSAARQAIYSIPNTADAAKRLANVQTKINRLQPLFRTTAEFDDFTRSVQAAGIKFDTSSKVLAGSQTAQRLNQQAEGAVDDAFFNAARQVPRTGGDVTAALGLAAKGLRRIAAEPAKPITESTRGQIARYLTESDSKNQRTILNNIERYLLQQQAIAESSATRRQAGKVATSAIVARRDANR
jgi:hypothetical protein